MDALMNSTHSLAYDDQAVRQVQVPTTREFLVFRLGNEEYGLNIHDVQELRSYEKTTCLADAPSYLKGMINLRGVIVPIVDLRILLNGGTATYDQFTVVIILNLAGRLTGAVVDGVADVVALSRKDIKPAPEMHGALDAGYLLGLGTQDQRMLILIDISKLLPAFNGARLQQ